MLVRDSKGTKMLQVRDGKGTQMLVRDGKGTQMLQVRDSRELQPCQVSQRELQRVANCLHFNFQPLHIMI